MSYIDFWRRNRWLKKTLARTLTKKMLSRLFRQARYHHFNQYHRHQHYWIGKIILWKSNLDEFLRVLRLSRPLRRSRPPRCRPTSCGSSREPHSLQCRPGKKNSRRMYVLPSKKSNITTSFESNVTSFKEDSKNSVQYSYKNSR